jgi:hypothetical protein
MLCLVIRCVEVTDISIVHQSVRLRKDTKGRALIFLVPRGPMGSHVPSHSHKKSSHPMWDSHATCVPWGFPTGHIGKLKMKPDKVPSEKVSVTPHEAKRRQMTPWQLHMMSHKWPNRWTPLLMQQAPCAICVHACGDMHTCMQVSDRAANTLGMLHTK